MPPLPPPNLRRASRRIALLGSAALLSGAWFPHGRSGGQQQPSITSITLSGTHTYPSGSPDGTVVGTISVNVTQLSFDGTLALSGTDAAKFRISGSSLLTNGTIGDGPYSVTITATDPTFGNSGFSQSFSVSGVLIPTITSILLSGDKTYISGSPDGTIVGAISVTVSVGAFSGTFSVGGTGAANFRISGSNLLTNGAIGDGPFGITIIATDTNFVNSGFSQAFTISGVASQQASILGISVPTAFPTGSPDGTIVGPVTVAVSSGTADASNTTLGGTDAAKFRISGGNLLTVGALGDGPWHITLTKTDATYSNSPYTTPTPIAIGGVSGAIAVATMNGVQHTFSEAAATAWDPISDPLAPLLGIAPRFTMTMKAQTITTASGPLHSIFYRIGAWFRVGFEAGDWTNPDVEHANLPGYSVSVNGGTPQSVPRHPRYARWSITSGPWPFTRIPVADLIAAKLILKPGAHSWSMATPMSHSDYEPMGISFASGIGNVLGADTPISGQATGAGAYYGPITFMQWSHALIDSDATYAGILGSADGSGTFPMYHRDWATGAMVDIISTPSLANQIPAQTDRTYVDVVITGPPGTILQNDIYHGFFDAPGGGTGDSQYRFQGTDFIGWPYGGYGIIIPESGTITTTCVSGYASFDVPHYNAPYLRIPIEGVSLAYVPNTVYPGSGIGFDIGHQPNLVTMAFLTTGDPFHLESLQVQALNCTYGVRTTPPTAPYDGWGFGQGRAMMAAMTAIMCAAAYTPSGTVPNWLLPKAGFQAWLTYEFKFWLDRYGTNGTRSDAVIFHTLCSNTTGYDNSWLNDADEPDTIWTKSYEFMMVLVTTFWAWQLQKGGHIDGDWEPYCRWSIQNAIERNDGLHGWMRSAASTWMVIKLAGQPAFATWADAWLWNWTNNYGGGYGGTAVDDNNYNWGGGGDYIQWDYAVLSLALYFGITSAQTAYNALDTFMHVMSPPGGTPIQWNRLFATS